MSEEKQTPNPAPSPTEDTAAAEAKAAWDEYVKQDEAGGTQSSETDTPVSADAGDSAGDSDATKAKDAADAVSDAKEPVSADADAGGKADPPDEPPEADDPLAALPKEQQDLVKGYIESEIKRDRNTVAALQRKLDRLQDDLRQQPVRQVDQNAPALGDKVKEGLEALRDEMSEEAYAAISGIVEGLTSEVTGLTEAEIQRAQKVTEASNRDIQEQATVIDELHPGWQDLLKANGKAYFAWVNDDDRPVWVRKAAAENHSQITNAKSAARLFKAFEKSLGKAEPDPKQKATEPVDTKSRRQLDALDAPPNNMSRAARLKSEPDENDTKGWWRHYTEKDAKERAQA